MEQVSTIIRFHQTADTRYLQDAIFSVVIQNHVKNEIILCTQNCSKDQLDMAKSFLDSCAVPGKVCYHILSFNDEQDIRAKLLNQGISKASSSYIHILDYDDLIYQNCYFNLVHKLKSGPYVIAAGAAKIVYLETQNKLTDFYHVTAKKSFHNRPLALFDFVFDNHLPIHSFIIDKTKIGNEDLVFDENIEALEDYKFLLKILFKYPAIFPDLQSYVCEYRIRNDQNHTTPFHDLASINTNPKWEKGRQIINELKANMKIELTLKQISDCYRPSWTSPKNKM